MTQKEEIYSEAQLIAQELLDRHTDKINIPRMIGEELTFAITFLISSKPEILQYAKQRLDLKQKARKDWIEKIIPPKPSIDIENLL